MLSSIKQSTKDSIVYGLGNIAVKLVGFILIPLYTNPKIISIDDFGVMAILDITGLILISLMASALPQSLMRWYWDPDHKKDQKEIFFMALLSQILVSLLFVILLFPFAGQISTLIFGSEKWSFALRLVILSNALQSINNIINYLMRVQSRSILYSAANLIKLVFVLLLTIILIVFRKMGIPGIYLAQVIGNMVFILCLSVYAVRNCVPSVKLKLLRAMANYGFPLMLANFAGASYSAIDRFSLNSLTLLKFVAVYSLAFKISSVLKLVIVDSIKMAVTPMVIKKMDTPDSNRFYSKTNLYSSLVLMMGIIAVSLFSFEAIKVITKSTQFWGAYIIVPLLSLSVFFVNMRETTIWGLIIRKKTWIMGLIVIFSTILNIFLNILLIPIFNMMGAALATIITNLIYWYACFYFAQKALSVPYELNKILIILIVGTLLSFSGFLVNDLQVLPRLILKLLLLISFPFILHLFRFYEPAELKAVRGFVSKWSNLRNFRENLKSLRGNTESSNNSL
jgi:O-antigen/teichoic acid export membrane protein